MPQYDSDVERLEADVERLEAEIERLREYISEVRCCKCDGVVTEFTIPNKTWNTVVRKNGPETNREYLCIQCFADIAAAEIERLQDGYSNWAMLCEAQGKLIDHLREQPDAAKGK